MAFAKLKAFLKKHAPRTVDALWDTIARGIDTEPPWVCRRLRTLRGWSDGQAGDRGTAFTGRARASGADRAGACARVRLAMGSGQLDCRQDQMPGGAGEPQGSGGRGQCGAGAGASERGPGADHGARGGERGAAAGATE